MKLNATNAKSCRHSRVKKKTTNSFSWALTWEQRRQQKHWILFVTMHIARCTHSHVSKWLMTLIKCIRVGCIVIVSFVCFVVFYLLVADEMFFFLCLFGRLSQIAGGCCRCKTSSIFFSSSPFHFIKWNLRQLWQLAVPNKLLQTPTSLLFVRQMKEKICREWMSVACVCARVTVKMMNPNLLFYSCMVHLERKREREEEWEKERESGVLFSFRIRLSSNAKWMNTWLNR